MTPWSSQWSYSRVWMEQCGLSFWKNEPGAQTTSQKEGKREGEIVGSEIGSGSDLNCYKTL